MDRPPQGALRFFAQSAGRNVYGKGHAARHAVGAMGQSHAIEAEMSRFIVG